MAYSVQHLRFRIAAKFSFATGDTRVGRLRAARTVAKGMTMTLKPDEFIRRFLMHVLPNGFHRIRHCGLLASGTKTETIARALLIATVTPVQTAHQLQPPDSAPATDQATHPCPYCGGRMNIIETFNRGSTPQYRPPSPTVIRIDTS